MATYKYADSHDWLEEKITGTSDLDYLRGVIRALAGKCGGGDLQELFQREMSDDGYFTAQVFLNKYECPKCGQKWADYWDSGCDDDCPDCGARHISPYSSEEVV